MEMISSKVKFIAIIFIGIFSLILLYERIGYNNSNNNYFSQYINRSLFGPNVINKGLIENDISITSQEKSSFRPGMNLYLNRSNRFDSEYYVLKTKVLEFEAKYLVPIVKRPQNSRLLYSDVVKEITHMTIGGEKCDNSYGNDLKVVIIVISRVNGFKRRQILRQSWAKRIPESKDVKLYFALGLTENSETQNQIRDERKEFNDLLQFDFIDNYYNLTVKSIGILRWVTLHCFKVPFIYKVDDDCIINIDNLIQFSEKASKNTIYGHLWKNAFVDRNRNSKFFISRADYKLNSYPDYTGGPWLISTAIVPLLYETALKSLPALPWEDVFITGIVAKGAGIERKNLNGLVYFAESMFNRLNYCWFRENIIFWQSLDDLMITNLWKNIENTRDMICVQNGTTIYPKIV